MEVGTHFRSCWISWSSSRQRGRNRLVDVLDADLYLVGNGPCEASVALGASVAWMKKKRAFNHMIMEGLERKY
jgi:hypothetical protein